MYFDFFVNGSVIALLLVFLLTRRMNKDKLKEKLFERGTAKIILVALWIILTGAFVTSALLYPELERSHDIDDAVEAASEHFLDGGNPYKDDVVPRFSERYHGSDTTITNSTYNYQPLSLFTYSFFFVVLGPIGSLWFPLTNLLFGVLTIAALSFTFPKLHKRYSIPVIGTISIFFMFDNIMLTLLFLSLTFYFLVRSGSRYRFFFGLLFLFLGFFIKMIGMISLAVLIIYLFQRYRFRNRDVNLQIGAFIGTAFLIAVPSILVFGIMNVANSTVFYFSDVALRSESSGYGGTILTLLLGSSPYFSLFTNTLLLSLIAGSLFIKDIYTRLFLPEALLPFITIKASQALLVIPFYSLMILLILDLYPDFETSGWRKEKRR
ncbi:MAG: hypothetical protein U9R75_10455 [Candidatus Thermoplasmatota archaeon]|nr:hypothetical protein [Candidatus Thermoplasmatota archaeon]